MAWDRSTCVELEHKRRPKRYFDHALGRGRQRLLGLTVQLAGTAMRAAWSPYRVRMSDSTEDLAAELGLDEGDVRVLLRSWASRPRTCPTSSQRSFAWRSAQTANAPRRSATTGQGRTTSRGGGSVSAGRTRRLNSAASPVSRGAKLPAAVPRWSPARAGVEADGQCQQDGCAAPRSLDHVGVHGENSLRARELLRRGLVTS